MSNFIVSTLCLLFIGSSFAFMLHQAANEIETQQRYSSEYLNNTCTTDSECEDIK